MSQTPCILVTGGAGYIGSHVCRSLHERGFVPVTFDNLRTGHREAVQWGPLEEGDILDAPRLADVIARHRPAAAMHFAASSLVAQSVSDPGAYYRNNVVGSLTLVEALVRAGLDAIVFSSTCAVYGEPRTELLEEDHPREPVNPYGATKLAIERMLEDFSAAGRLRHATLRYFNAAGADPEARIGEAHDPETHLIPLVLQVASGRREAIHVFGNDYPTPDGTCIRDYIDVNDLAEAHLLALERLLDGGESMTLNLGTGSGTSVLELVEAARRVTDREIPVVSAERRPGDPARLVAGSGIASDLLGWRPKFESIDDILHHAWQWEQKLAAGRAFG
ncbi:MAG: UDP-glucose 4-epimerase GalE [Gammaproteobacteria bacterium]|jgi:UDP-glucose-4-epimerase GalE|nr:UDP-glucose 4-epimerase GalE [Gammaproteobacteria bacterium]